MLMKLTYREEEEEEAAVSCPFALDPDPRRAAYPV